MNHKIRVLHVLQSMVHGGIETFLMSMFRNYDADQFSMEVVYTGSQQGDYAEELEKLGIRLSPCRMKYEQVRFVFSLYRFMKKNAFHCVHSHFEDFGGPVMLAAWMAGIPVRVTGYHSKKLDMGPLKNLYTWFMRRWVLLFSTCITTSSDEVTNSFFNDRQRANKDIRPIAYGVDVSYFAEKSAGCLDFAKYNINRESHLIVGNVGSFRPQKNHHGLLQVVQRTIQFVPNTVFLFRGAFCDGNMVRGYTREDIEAYARHLNIEAHVRLIDPLNDMRKYYNSLDVFILPSKHEGMPISIIEAQAVSCPVVASNIEGIVNATAPEMRDNLFHYDDIDGISKCLIELLGDKQKRVEQGRAGYEFVRNNLDIKTVTRKFQAIYAGIEP